MSSITLAKQNILEQLRAGGCAVPDVDKIVDNIVDRVFKKYKTDSSVITSRRCSQLTSLGPIYTSTSEDNKFTVVASLRGNHLVSGVSKRSTRSYTSKVRDEKGAVVKKYHHTGDSYNPGIGFSLAFSRFLNQLTDL